ncbi:hypothetical protein SAMN05216559_2325 [Halomicrobium zhouii]|uniref:Uncharacterized protein n=1 Tax=Halomicrobium zhouii TaxID=767519 RepID=A0A1I6L9R1_9EURY|nr:hypothetical protein SAMN05216559_2325 [Halomicrobium zhouii]
MNCPQDRCYLSFPGESEYSSRATKFEQQPAKCKGGDLSMGAKHYCLLDNGGTGARHYEIAESRVPLDVLPEYGLVERAASGPAIHRAPAPSELSDESKNPLPIRPACRSGRQPYRTDHLGREETKEYKRVTIARRLPFDSYALCSNPECFHGITVRDA